MSFYFDEENIKAYIEIEESDLLYIVMKKV